MRVIILVAAVTLFLSGCTGTPPTTSIKPAPSTQPLAPPPATGSWRVIPLNTTTFPHRAAILVNEQTGETWIYNPDQWVPLTRH
jgi:ABC-type uncharacterized transport system auxiliary subunit